MSILGHAHEGLYVLDMHIEIRYILKVHNFFIEHGTDIIPVSLYSLNNQLSFDTQHLISNESFIWYFTAEMVKKVEIGQFKF